MDKVIYTSSIGLDKIVCTLIIGAIGGMLGVKFKIPAGAMIGSMVFVGIYNVFIGKAYVPSNFKTIAQIVIGCIIGLNFTMDSILGLRKLIIPSIILVIGLTTLSIILGLILHKTTGLDLSTALFSAAPGGLTDMVIMSESFGAQTHIVALLHLIRLTTVLTVLPIVIKFVTEKLL